jgi:hypothetical protein
MILTWDASELLQAELSKMDALCEIIFLSKHFLHRVNLQLFSKYVKISSFFF